MTGLSLGMAGLSLIGGIWQNGAASKAYVQNAEQVTKNYFTTIAQLQEQAKSADEAIRLEMTSQQFDALKNTALTSNTIVERNVAGNTATRIYEQSFINKTMAHNVLAKKAEDTAVSYGVEMENKQREANNAIYAGQAQAMSNTVSTTSMISSSINASIKGYQLGSLGLFS